VISLIVLAVLAASLAGSTRKAGWFGATTAHTFFHMLGRYEGRTMYALIGIAAVFAAVLGGFLLENGNPYVLFQPAELLIVEAPPLES
jgi:hypothetical protein